MRSIVLVAALLAGSMAMPAAAQPGPAPLVSRQTPIAPLAKPPGDIPDSQTFVTYRSALGFSVKAPEGWSRRERADGVSFTDKYGSLTVDLADTPTPPTPASARQVQAGALEARPEAVTVSRIATATPPTAYLAGRPPVVIAFASNSAPNPVTGKSIRLENEQYLFWHHGKLATLTLSAPFGADNADQWQLMAQSFEWR